MIVPWHHGTVASMAAIAREPTLPGATRTEHDASHASTRALDEVFVAMVCKASDEAGDDTAVARAVAAACVAIDGATAGVVRSAARVSLDCSRGHWDASGMARKWRLCCMS